VNVSDALDIRLGATGVTAVYVGATKVWPVGGGAFDPFGVGWHCAAWADDPNWTNPGDGNAVDSWLDGTGNGRTPVQASGSLQPVFRAAVADLNGHAAVQFDGADDWLASAPFTSQANPTLVWIGTADGPGLGGNPRLVDCTADAAPYTSLFIRSGSTKWATYSGGFFLSTEDYNDPGAHAIRLRTTSGVGSTINVDGIDSPYTALDSDVAVRFGISLSGSSAAAMHVAFAGIYIGDVTTDPGWPAFVAGVADYYGLTIG
jgi:hypothetical protein